MNTEATDDDDDACDDDACNDDDDDDDIFRWLDISFLFTNNNMPTLLSSRRMGNAMIERALGLNTRTCDTWASIAMTHRGYIYGRWVSYVGRIRVEKGERVRYVPIALSPDLHIAPDILSLLPYQTIWQVSLTHCHPRPSSYLLLLLF